MTLTHWTSSIPWTAITAQELADLIDMAQTEHARRQRLAAEPPQSKMVAVSLTLDAGNTRAGAKSWCKVITRLDPSKGNGYGIEGEFLRPGYDSKRRSTGAYTAGLSEGTLLLIGGSGAGVQFICSTQSGPKTGYDQQAMLDDRCKALYVGHSGILGIEHAIGVPGKIFQRVVMT